MAGHDRSRRRDTTDVGSDIATRIKIIVFTAFCVIASTTPKPADAGGLISNFDGTVVELVTQLCPDGKCKTFRSVTRFVGDEILVTGTTNRVFRIGTNIVPEGTMVVSVIGKTIYYDFTNTQGYKIQTSTNLGETRCSYGQDLPGLPASSYQKVISCRVTRETRKAGGDRPQPGRRDAGPAPDEGCYDALPFEEGRCSNKDSLSVRVRNTRCQAPIMVRICIPTRSGKPDCSAYDVPDGGAASHFACMPTATASQTFSVQRLR